MITPTPPAATSSADLFTLPRSSPLERSLHARRALAALVPRVVLRVAYSRTGDALGATPRESWLWATPVGWTFEVRAAWSLDPAPARPVHVPVETAETDAAEAP